MKKVILILPVLLLLYSCTSKPTILGNWVEPVSGSYHMNQGFTLHDNGSASSINMHTLVYEKWHMDGDSIFLSGKSIGNGQTIEFTNGYRIAKLTTDSLTLETDMLYISYTRDKM